MKLFKDTKRGLALLLLALLTLSLCTGCGEVLYDAAMELDAQIQAEESQNEVLIPEQDDPVDPKEDETEIFDTDDPAEEAAAPDEAEGPEEDLIDPDGVYTSKEEVAEYLWTWGELPSNFITKKQARQLGWEGGSLEPFDPGKCIGGDTFGNREKLLPEGDYRECDIDTLEADKRGAKRLVYTADCSRIYYTDDHYESFTLLYGEE